MAFLQVCKFIALIVVLVQGLARKGPDEEKVETLERNDVRNLVVNSLLNVNVTLNAEIKTAQLKIIAKDSYIKSINTYVLPSMFGNTLFLSVNPFALGPKAIRTKTAVGAVKIEVPKPLHSIQAARGASVISDVVQGEVIADSGATVNVTTVLDFQQSYRLVLFRASRESYIKIDNGTIEHALLQAASAGVLNLSNVTIRHARVSAVADGKVMLRANKTVSVSCSSGASVNISGSAEVRKLFTNGCDVKTEAGMNVTDSDDDDHKHGDLFFP
eukprot:TRINITY_DN79763_c0_g1_i1.p1 TRINITY_DN79763_c0_g1~~TRINITY_DN79763_c0_g1_i1.p1  ORF type:complete len:272 (-),score=49.83 TRINITY_DN79763_c0_g1_i1:570-1385(-)